LLKKNQTDPTKLLGRTTRFENGEEPIGAIDGTGGGGRRLGRMKIDA